MEDLKSILKRMQVQITGEPIGINSTDELKQALYILKIEGLTEEFAKTMAGDVVEAARSKIACQSCEKVGEETKECSRTQIVFDDFLQRFHTESCHCKKAIAYMQSQKIEKMFSGTKLGKRFLKRRFETFEVTTGNQKAYNMCQAFVKNYKPDCKGLILRGTYGTGKTHLAAAIIVELLKKNIVGVFVVVPDLLRSIRQSFDIGNKDNKDLQELFDTVKKAELLVLDDLGAENSGKWVKEQLFILINTRYENMLPTIITTNCSMAEIADQLDERVASRLVEMTDQVSIQATDRRLIQGNVTG